jgi:hypothetical protein
VNFNNIKPDEQSQYTTKDAYVAGKYDYESIMHYPMINSDHAIVMTPINCEPNCPKKLGNSVGLSKLDQKQLVAMYQCKAY